MSIPGTRPIAINVIDFANAFAFLAFIAISEKVSVKSIGCVSLLPVNYALKLKVDGEVLNLTEIVLKSKSGRSTRRLKVSIYAVTHDVIVYYGP